MKTRQMSHAALLREPLFRRAIDNLSKETLTPESVLEEHAKKQTRSLADKVSRPAVVIYSQLLAMVFRRMFTAIAADESGLAKVGEAMHRSPVVFVPNRRSHIDYPLVSRLCAQYGLPVPHIAAGENLSFGRGLPLPQWRRLLPASLVQKRCAL